jgi:membrane-bound lytic murein transglycosylase F
MHIAVGLIVALLVFWALVLTPMYTGKPLDRLQSIQKRGYLNLLTLNAASTYYEDASGANGFEYELARLFADHIKVMLNVIVVDRFEAIYSELSYDAGDIAAAGLSVQDLHAGPLIEFGPAYYQTTQQVLYRRDANNRPG